MVERCIHIAKATGSIPVPPIVGHKIDSMSLMKISRFYYILSLFFVFMLPAAILSFFVIDQIPLANLFTFVLGITILGSIWDIWATKHTKKDPVWIWQFNFKDTIGIKMFGLPIEEYIFYVVSSIYIVFVWEGIRYALQIGTISMYLMLPFVGLWSLLCILVPYRFKEKKDII